MGESLRMRKEEGKRTQNIQGMMATGHKSKPQCGMEMKIFASFPEEPTRMICRYIVALSSKLTD